MPEVNLKEYFNRLDGLIDDGAADEVIHHARHILSYYPKNVQVYQFLGRALVLIGRYDEAQAALRRVLSVIPDDFIANVALGEVFERTNRCDDAIYHLERALDQRPSDKDILDALRVLYHRCRKTGQLKIQMTAGSVARQHWRSGAPDYAIETLRSALKTSADRVDLRLLLAQILWGSGREEEAAESALDVLKQLPDCLEANRILAELWLNYSRPSDAQRFVNRIESVDPYLAIALVQGSPADDDAFRVEELDYQRSAKSDAVASRPDWLKDLSAAAVVEGVPSDAPPTVEDEWSSWSSAMLSSQTIPAPEQPVSAEHDLDWLSSFPMRQEEEAVSASPSGVSDADLDALFGTDNLPQPRPAAYAPAPPTDADPFAWMQDAGVELTDEQPSAYDAPDFDDLFTQPNATPVEQDENPLAWMTQFDSDLLIDAAPTPSAQLYDPYEASPAEFTTPSSQFELDAGQPDDDLDWLRGAIEQDGAPIDGSTSDAFSEFTEPTASIPESPAPVSGQRRGLTSILSEGNFDWLNNAPDSPAASTNETEMDDWLNQFGAAPAKPVSPTDTPDWLTDLDTGPASAGVGDAPMTATGAAEDNLFNLFTSDYAVDPTDKDETSAVFNPQQEERMWMSEPEPRDDEQPERPEDAADNLDWLSEFAPTDAPMRPSDPLPSTDTESWDSVMGIGAGMGAGDEFSFDNLTLNSDDEADDALTASTDDIPDWLRDVAPSLADPNAAAEETITTGDDLAWLTDDVINATEAQLAAAAQAGALSGFDTLDEMALFSTANTAAPIEDEFTLDDLVAVEADAISFDAAIDLSSDEGVPDWLMELQPADSVPVNATADTIPGIEGDDETSDWLSALPAVELPESLYDADEVAAVAAIEDELGFALPQPVTASSEDEFDWLSLAEPETTDAAVAAIDEFAQPELAAAAPADEFDWLNLAEPETTDAAVPLALDEFAQPDLVTTDEFDWLSAASPEFTEEPMMLADEPESMDDDMPELDREAETVIPAVEEMVEDEGLFDDYDDAEVERAAPINTPDWLNAMVPGLDVDTTAQEYILPDEEFDLVEQELLPIDSTSTNAEFGWLTAIVDEELAAGRPVVRFAFSRPPAWARATTSAVDDDDEFPEWIADDDGE